MPNTITPYAKNLHIKTNHKHTTSIRNTKFKIIDIPNTNLNTTIFFEDFFISTSYAHSCSTKSCHHYFLLLFPDSNFALINALITSLSLYVKSSSTSVKGVTKFLLVYFIGATNKTSFRITHCPISPHLYRTPV